MAGQPLAIQLIEGIFEDPAVDLFHSPEERAYITLVIQGQRKTLPIPDPAVDRQVVRLLVELGKPPSKTLVNTICAGLEALAFDSECQPVYTRIANLGDQVVIDLGDDSGQAIICTGSGWRVASEAPVPFLRPPGIRALPMPERAAGALETFRLVCAAAMREDAFHLVAGWLVSALIGRPPFPLLLLWGGYGSGKSSTAGMLRGLVDPNEVPLRAVPASERDLAITADKSVVLAFDNVSLIDPDISDALCRITSGDGGLATRKLYTDRAEELFHSSRPVLMTSVHDIVAADDLRDRTLLVPVQPLPNRLTQASLAGHYEDLRPGVLAELLDGVCAALAPPAEDASRPGLPRLADAALAADAALEALGYGRYAFTHALDASHATRLRNR